MSKALAVKNGGKVFVNEKTTLVEGGRTITFPCCGVVDGSGIFRLLTDDETKDREASVDIKKEADAAHSPISLRAHPTSDKKYVYIGTRGSAPFVGEYNPGSAQLVDADELKVSPFEKTGKINGMEVDQEHLTGAHIGGAGQFRLRVPGSDRVWKIVYRYGYAPNGENILNIDGVYNEFS